MGPGDHVILVLHHHTNTAVNVILDHCYELDPNLIFYT